MRDYFATDDMQALLRAAAHSWFGTPFRKWQRVKGHGVDCVQLAGALYIETKHLVEFEPGHYPMDGGDHLEQSLVLEWLHASDHFRKIEWLEPRAGDLLCFRMNRMPHHVGVLLDRGAAFVHCAKFIGGVRYNSLHDPTYSKRLSHIFRPVTP